MRKFFTIAIIALSINAFAQIPTTGLVGYFPFNGNANDESGNVNNGIVHGATLTTDRFGASNKAYSFNGISDYIELNASFGNFGVGDFSISAWIDCTNFPNSTYLQPVFSKRNIAAYGNFMGFGVNVSKVIVELDESSLSDYSNSTSDMSLLTDKWYNISMIRQGNSLKIFINGVFNKEVLTSITHNISNSAISAIGSSNNGSSWSGDGQNFNGKIDDIRIYNRALNQSEITTLSNENITGFNPINYKNTIKVFPNPTKDHFTIDFGSNYSTMNGFTLKITNALSQIVYSTSVNQQQIAVDLSTWSGNGIFFVTLFDANSNTKDIQKIILE